MWLFWGAIFEFFVQIWVNLSDFEWRFIKFSYHSLMKTTRESETFKFSLKKFAKMSK